MGEQESFCCAPRWQGLPLCLPKARFLVGQNNSTSLLQSPLSLWTATLIAPDMNILWGPDFWEMHRQERKVNCASVPAEGIPPCSNCRSCSPFQQPLYAHPGLAAVLPALPYEPLAAQLPFICYPQERWPRETVGGSPLRLVLISYQGAAHSTPAAVSDCCCSCKLGDTIKDKQGCG